ncbi:MAG: PD-(D/E)XK nuclease family protein [Candidatus Heimdallarchaeota archaeon]
MLEKEFVLSKTEFVAFLKCPFQFYLLKELYKPTNQKRRNNYSDYEQFLQDGLDNHLWLQNFYKNFSVDIKSNIDPLLKLPDEADYWKRNFVNFEVKRYKEKNDFWEPVAVEFYLCNDSFCGTIDRIDLLNELGDCRIVEYKSYPSEFDEEELLFYTVLLTNHLPIIDVPNITKVTEFGIYYYKINEFYKAKVTPEIINTFEEYLEKLRTEMLDPSFIKKKKTCDFTNSRCLYREICKRIHIKHQKIFGHSKT